MKCALLFERPVGFFPTFVDNVVSGEGSSAAVRGKQKLLEVKASENARSRQESHLSLNEAAVEVEYSVPHVLPVRGVQQVAGLRVQGLRNSLKDGQQCVPMKRPNIRPIV